MSMSVNTNISAMNSQRHLTNTDSAMQKSLEKLSSGYRINKASDDAAGLAISEKMRGQIKGLNQAQRNAQDGISLLQTAEGALNETHSILQRMRELSVQAANGTLATEDRTAIKTEMDELTLEITRISSDTEFNGKKLLSGNFTADLQIGANAAQKLTISTSNMDATTLGVGTLTVDTYANANAATTALDAAIKDVSTQRSSLGAWQNRLEHTINNLGTSAENLTAAESRVRDVDMAKEMSEFTKNQVLSQAGISMLAQANQSSQSILKLLG